MKRLAPGQPRTARQTVTDTLRRAILSGDLPGGSRLAQADIAEQLQVSTTPVREALRDLAAEGLVRLDTHRGAMVHECSIAELEEVYLLRHVLEPVAIRRSLQLITDAELDRAEAILIQMEGETDYGAWADLNREFHALIEGPARYPRLLAILKSLRDVSAPYVGLSMQMAERGFPRANREHRAILDASRARDADRTIAMALEHLSATRNSISEDDITRVTKLRPA